MFHELIWQMSRSRSHGWQKIDLDLLIRDYKTGHRYDIPQIFLVLYRFHHIPGTACVARVPVAASCFLFAYLMSSNTNTGSDGRISICPVL